jgi:hypothetical protein
LRRQRGHRARLYLTADQLAKVEEQGHGVRAVWNLLHELWQTTPKCQLSLSRMDEAIRQARKDIPWLEAVPAQAAQAVLKTYHRAWANCWEGRAQAPAFKKRTVPRAVDIPQGRDLRITRLSRHRGRCWVPMVGLVTFRWTKGLPVGKRADKLTRITGARLVDDALGWHIVFRVQSEAEEPKPHEGPIVGIDRGIAKPLALSDARSANTDPGTPPARRSGSSAWNGSANASAPTARRASPPRTGFAAPATRSSSSAQEPRAAPLTGSTREPPNSPTPSASSGWKTWPSATWSSPLGGLWTPPAATSGKKPG